MAFPPEKDLKDSRKINASVNFSTLPYRKKNLSLPRKEKNRIMLIVPVKEGESIDRALKRFKRKFDRTKMMREIRERMQYTKPSVKRRQQILRARYRELKRQMED